MIGAKLKAKDGTVIAEIQLPESAAEMSLIKYVSFLTEMKRFELPDANPIETMCRAVSEATGVDINTLLQAKFGAEWTENSGLDGGIRSLYGWIVRAVSNYQGGARTNKDCSFQYQGETYKIPFIVAAEISGGLALLPEVETGEAIEAYETIRGFQQQIKDAGDPAKERTKRIASLRGEIAKGSDTDGSMMREAKRLEAEIEIDGDPNGNLLFAQYLRLIAILAKKEGEKLPAKDGDRERWIQNRMIRFQHIDTKTALDVDFFLTGLSNPSVPIHPAIGSLILPLFALAATIQSRPQPKGKRTIGQYRTRKKYKNGSVGAR